MEQSHSDPEQQKTHLAVGSIHTPTATIPR